MTATAFDPGTDCWCACGASCEVTAMYLWTAALSGNRIRLCAFCCASWRMRAESIPDLAPSRIQLLSLTNAK